MKNHNIFSIIRICLPQLQLRDLQLNQTSYFPIVLTLRPCAHKLLEPRRQLGDYFNIHTYKSKKVTLMSLRHVSSIYRSKFRSNRPTVTLAQEARVRLALIAEFPCDMDI